MTPQPVKIDIKSHRLFNTPMSRKAPKPVHLNVILVCSILALVVAPLFMLAGSHKHLDAFMSSKLDFGIIPFLPDLSQHVTDDAEIVNVEEFENEPPAGPKRVWSEPSPEQNAQHLESIKQNLPHDFLLLPSPQTRPLKPRAVITSFFTVSKDGLSDPTLICAELQTFLFLHNNSTRLASDSDTEFIVLLSNHASLKVRQKFLLLGARLLLVPPLTRFSVPADPRYLILQLWKLEGVFDCVLYIESTELVFLDSKPVEKIFAYLDNTESRKEGDAFYNPNHEFFGAVVKSVETQNPSGIVARGNLFAKTSKLQLKAQIKNDGKTVVERGLMLFTPRKTHFEGLIQQVIRIAEVAGEMPDGDVLEESVIGSYFAELGDAKVTQISAKFNTDPATVAGSQNRLQKIVGLRQLWWGVGMDQSEPFRFPEYAEKLQQLRQLETQLFSASIQQEDRSLPLSPVVPSDFGAFRKIVDSGVMLHQIALVSPNATPTEEVLKREAYASHLMQAVHSVANGEGFVEELRVAVQLLTATDCVLIFPPGATVENTEEPLLHVWMGAFHDSVNDKGILLIGEKGKEAKAGLLLKKRMLEKLTLFQSDLMSRSELFADSSRARHEILEEMIRFFAWE
ncbi:hypothetical protein HDU98_007354, partial [Podochytrium sp. JEL0797]